VEPMKML